MISSLIRAFNAIIDKWLLLNVSTATYASLSIYVSYNATGVIALTFSSDGTKMYILSSTNDTIYQYTLSTPWDVSTASYASLSKSVAAQDTLQYGLAFSTDGTKMYIIGFTNDTIYQYTLSTPWNVSTASYASLSKSVAAQTTDPHGLTFSPDGTKMYIMGKTSKTVYQYTLSTPWNVSTATYASLSVLVSAQEGNPYGVAFSPDGTKMFIVGTTNDTIYQYTLSTPWDVSTASYASLSKSVAAQDVNPWGLTFSTDGTKMYILGISSNTVYQYTT